MGAIHYEYAIEVRTFDMADDGTQWLAWYDTQGWEICQVKSAFDRDAATVQQSVTMRRIKLAEDEA